MGGGDLDGAATLLRAERLFEQLGLRCPVLALMSSALPPGVGLLGQQQGGGGGSAAHPARASASELSMDASIAAAEAADGSLAGHGHGLQQGESVRALPRLSRGNSAGCAGAAPPEHGRWVLLSKPVTLEAAQALVYTAWVAQRRRSVAGGGTQVGMILPGGLIHATAQGRALSVSGDGASGSGSSGV